MLSYLWHLFGVTFWPRGQSAGECRAGVHGVSTVCTGFLWEATSQGRLEGAGLHESVGGGCAVSKLGADCSCCAGS